MGKINLTNKEIGDWGEQVAVDYLHNHNVKIIARKGFKEDLMGID